MAPKSDLKQSSNSKAKTKTKPEKYEKQNKTKNTDKKATKQKNKSKSPDPTNSRSPQNKRNQKANKITKQQKQKLLQAKIERQGHRNKQMMRMRRQLQGKDQLKKKEQSTEVKELDDDSVLAEHNRESLSSRFLACLKVFLTSLVSFFTVTLRSDRTFDWLVFIVNIFGLYQEYEINDYGQRLSPRTGRPVLLSLGPLRVVQILESADELRSYWDPFIRDFLRNSSLTTDCWRANRMAMQVALCMDDAGTMHDMPLDISAKEAEESKDISEVAVDE